MNSVYGDRLLTCRIAPFGHPRIKARLQLPEAFRSLPRPSSAPSAKAFTLCSCSLDHYAILWFSFSAIVVSLPNISISKTILLIAVAFIVQFSMCRRAIPADSLAAFAVRCRTSLPLACLGSYPFGICCVSASHPPRSRIALAAPLGAGGLKWTRTTDLTLIRRAL